MEIPVSVFDDNCALREGPFYLISGTPAFEVSGVYPDFNFMLENLHTYPADVVLMDIDMSGLNGSEATALVKKVLPAAL